MTIQNNAASHDRYRTILGFLTSFATSFPDASAVAEFRPWSQTVHLHQVSAHTLRESLHREQLDYCRGAWQTIAHELTHWVDLLGTLWGQDYLFSLADAYKGAFGGDEAQFYSVVDHFDDDRRILFPVYYHVVADRPSPHSPDHPWTLDYTSGYEFSCDGRPNEARPIFFAVFGDNLTRKRISRQPLSAGALLETRATFSEMLTSLQIISGTDEASAIVESVIYGKEMTNLLYAPELTMYTAPVHALSAKSHTRDPMLSYELGSELAFISLNLTDELIGTIRNPEEFAPFTDRRAAFVRNKDRGYVFAALAFHAPQHIGQSHEEFIADTLAAAGLPPKDEIFLQAKAVFKKRLEMNVDLLPIRVIKSLCAVGAHCFDIMSDLEQPVVDLNMLFEHSEVFPFMYDRDGALFSLHGSSPGEHDPNEMLEAEYAMRAFLQNFLPACRGR